MSMNFHIFIFHLIASVILPLITIWALLSGPVTVPNLIVDILATRLLVGQERLSNVCLEAKVLPDNHRFRSQKKKIRIQWANGKQPKTLPAWGCCKLNSPATIIQSHTTPKSWVVESNLSLSHTFYEWKSSRENAQQTENETLSRALHAGTLALFCHSRVDATSLQTTEQLVVRVKVLSAVVHSCCVSSAVVHGSSNLNLDPCGREIHTVTSRENPHKSWCEFDLKLLFERKYRKKNSQTNRKKSPICI